MWRALQLVEFRVAEARSALPPNAELIVEKVTTGSFPVVTFNVSGPVDPRELREIAEYTVRPGARQRSWRRPDRSHRRRRTRVRDHPRPRGARTLFD